MSSSSNTTGSNSSASSRNTSRLSATSSERVSMAFIKRALTPTASWTHKEEFLDAVYWLRQVLSIIIGVILGALSIKGLLGMIIFAAISSLIVFIYASNVQNVDPEEYGGMIEIIKEGFMTALATFLVSWIVLYSAFNEPKSTIPTI
ncbi:unnamed protein product [Rotaria socialis]|uniref:Rab5-interacting protein n=1 Tax=Rotaria socialis TaxID=392032 RepID=A0A819UFG1_9BILA|nr:unnamed protein product [Rotaria socialis]CAF3479176.1 unnamed protein product [Rotaria socialis]CAF3501766.1 unnamed protein product [Rotaria socialis]CAF3529722.1 unnamed protein product [Rotaria socialis]CAF3587314.1 unnamed protein product [Rotaria socialis]